MLHPKSYRKTSYTIHKLLVKIMLEFIKKTRLMSKKAWEHTISVAAKTDCTEKKYFNL